MSPVSMRPAEAPSARALASTAGFPYAWFRGGADARPQTSVDAWAMSEQELTKRERRAAILLAYGHTNRDVARELEVSIRTAESERAHLMRKLGLRRRSELVQWALERGLLR